MAWIPDPNKDPDFYKNVSKNNMALRESFRWMTPSFSTTDVGKNSIKIKGVALRGDTVSKNNRKYVEEELIRSARTFIGRPVTINHSDQIVGNIDWCEYEDHCLEYLATIKKQPYVTMLRNKSTQIRGVSIEADYLRNVCPNCRKNFTSEAQFHDHMKQQHFIRTNPTREPHGIVGKAISLVLSPEECGSPDTSIELMETHGVNRLFEMILKNKNEGVKPIMKTTENKTVEQEQTLPIGYAINPLTNESEPIPDLMGKLDAIFQKASPEQMHNLFLSILGYADYNVQNFQRQLEQNNREISKNVNEQLVQMNRAISNVSSVQKVYFGNVQPKLKESFDLAERLHALEVRQDNIEAKVKPQFKGHSVRLTEISDSEDKPYVKDPNKK